MSISFKYGPFDKMPSLGIRIQLLATIIMAPLMLSGCITSMADIGTVQNSKHEAPIIYSSPVRSNVTPMSEALSCYSAQLQSSGKKPLGIAIGDVKDYTGKQGQDEGFAITQGGALMAYSALGKLGSAVRVHERFDTRIAEAELVYMNQRQLGDGNHHSIDDPSNAGEKTSVPWKPYFGGSIRQSDYFIVGGITELNYNIQSGGAEVAVSNVGPKARVYTMNIAVDLRIVGTQSLMVYDTVSIEKQLTGYEVGFGVFRFFGSKLFDINVGAKNSEPLQLGVRTAIEAGVLQLVASVAGVDPTSCLPSELGPIKWDGAKAVAIHADMAAQTASTTLPPPAKSGLADPTSFISSSIKASYAPEGGAEKVGAFMAARFSGSPSEETIDAGAILDLVETEATERAKPADGGEFAVLFSKSNQDLDRMSEATIRQIADLVRNGRRVNLTVSGGSDVELTPQERKAIEEVRIRIVVAELLRNGISKARASLLWQSLPDTAELNQASFGGSAAGLREIARIRVG